MTDEVVVAGGGPAGALTALLLARRGARVRLFERTRFPRSKLCGDTLNPGAMGVLARHLPLDGLHAVSQPIRGMRLGGPYGETVCGRYPEHVEGRAVTRAVLDAWLLAHAVQAGVQVEEGAAVAAPTVHDGRVTGVRVRMSSGDTPHRARLVVAADGRRSTIALALRLASQPARPRRWAIGAYFEGVDGNDPAFGEMHVRRGYYIGIAPVPGGLTNACVVVPQARARAVGAAPLDALVAALHADPWLAPRVAAARPVSKAMMLGPLASDAVSAA